MSNYQNSLVASLRTQRLMIGIVGLALPWACRLELWLTTGHSQALASISHYYFTPATTMFHACLILLGTFLIVYRGQGKDDQIVSWISGISCFMILLFPTNGLVQHPTQVFDTVLPISSWRNTIHYSAAALLFSCLAYMDIVVFTRSDQPTALQSSGKQQRNVLYHFSGLLILYCLVRIGLHKSPMQGDQFTYWMETIALSGFGISWLVKGMGSTINQ